jgi:hypothetical protein
MLLDDVTLNSARQLSVSIPIVEGVDLTKMKETFIEKVEQQLRHIADISHNNITLKKYVYEIAEVYPISDIVLVNMVDIDDIQNYELKDNQFIVNEKGRY